MSKSVPVGWTCSTLGDITVRKVDQGAPVSEVPYIDISSIDRDRKAIGELRAVDAASAPTRARQWVKTGDVLVSMTRPNLNAVAMVPERLDGAVASTGFDVLRAISVLPSWIFNRVRSREFVADVCQNLQGVVYPAIRPKDVRAHELPIPPLPEQHRIVDAIESYLTRLADAVASLERVQRNLECYRASVLKAAVEGRLVRTEAELARQEGRSYEPADVLLERILAKRRSRWIEDAAEKARAKAEAKALKAGKPWSTEGNVKALVKARETAEAKYKEPAPPDTTDLPTLPEGWCWATVDSVGEVKLGRQRSPKHHTGPHMRPYLRVANVFEDRIDTADVLEMNFTPAEYETYKLEAGDILLNEGQSLELVGRPAMYNDEIPGACFQNTLVRFRAHAGLSRRFALLVFLAYLHEGTFQRIARWTVNIAHLGATRFAQLAFPLPPIEEQRRIALEVDAAMTRIQVMARSADQAIRRALTLRQSILKWAFEGKLVEQDPNDEPASALLERIKAGGASE